LKRYEYVLSNFNNQLFPLIRGKYLIVDTEEEQHSYSCTKCTLIKLFSQVEGYWATDRRSKIQGLILLFY